MRACFGRSLAIEKQRFFDQLGHRRQKFALFGLPVGLFLTFFEKVLAVTAG